MWLVKEIGGPGVGSAGQGRTRSRELVAGAVACSAVSVVLKAPDHAQAWVCHPWQLPRWLGGGVRECLHVVVVEVPS